MKRNEETWWTIKFLKYYEDENSKYSLSSGVFETPQLESLCAKLGSCCVIRSYVDIDKAEGLMNFFVGVDGGQSWILKFFVETIFDIQNCCFPVQKYG